MAIIGVGPASLVYADALTRDGVEAVAFDCHPEIGGSLTLSIPVFKLEKGVVTYRHEILAGMGIEFKFDVEVSRSI